MNYWAISKHINRVLVWNSFSLLYTNIYDIVTYFQRSVLRYEAYRRLYFLTVARGPTVSQADRLIWPPDHIQCIDERIVVAKQRALETLNFVRYVFHTRTDIRDHRRERWRDPSIVGVVFKMRQRNHRKTNSSFWRIERYASRGLTIKFKPITSNNIVKHWVNFLYYVHHIIIKYIILY